MSRYAYEPSSSLLRGSATLLVLALVGAGCSDDPTGPGDEPDVEEVGAVVNSGEQTLTVFSADDPEDAASVDLAPDGSPVGLSVRGHRAVVPMGTLNAVAIVDLRDRVRVETVSLPEGSGATGSTFLGASEALVANPNLDTVSRLDVDEGEIVQEVEVGRFPGGMLVHEDRVWVANAELDEDFSPAEEGTLTVLDAGDLSMVGTVELSGLNPGALAVGPNGRIHVLNSGEFGEENGSLSVVDPGALDEVDHHEGFGDFPGSMVLGPDGRLHVGSYSYGVAVWDPGTASFVHPPDDAVEPGGVPVTAGVAFDSQGRFHAVEPGDFESPGRVLRLDTGYETDGEITAGVSPVGLAFSNLEGG